MAEGVDCGDDPGGIAHAHEVTKLDVGVLDHIVEHSASGKVARPAVHDRRRPSAADLRILV